MLRKWPNYTEKPPFGAQIDWSDPITDGLVGCWLFNELSGNLVQDLSNNENNGTISGATWSNGGLFFGNSLSDIVDLGVINLPNDFTLLVSVEWTNSDIYQAVLTKTLPTWASPYYIYALSNYSNSAFRLFVSDGVNYDQIVSDGTEIPGSIYQYAGVKDGSICKLFRDSVLQGTCVGYSATNNEPTSIGRPDKVADYAWDKHIFYVFIWNRALSDSEIERLYYEPYSFFLVPVPWFFIDLAAGQYSWNGNIPVSLIPSSVKEVRFYPQTGGAPIVITPQAEAQATYKAQGEQNIVLTPQGDIRAQYVEDGSVLVRLALAAEKQARFLAEGQVPLTLVPACEAQAAYEEAGDVPLALLPEASARASYALQGEVPLALQVSADIACAFNVAGGLGLILLPQGTWTYVPVTGGAVYTWAGNIPVALVPDATVATTYEIEGQAYVELSLASEVAAKYRHIGDLLLSLVPAGQASASWLIEGEIQLRLVPQGVAVLVKPSEQEDWYFVGVIEEDEIRAVFDDALHAKI